MVYQELSGIGALSVAENLFLGRQPTRAGRIDWSGMRQQAQDYLREMAIDVDVRRRLDRFPLVVRQMVEIARGLHSGARVLILEEPTRGMDVNAKDEVMRLVAGLKKSGAAVVLASTEPELVLAHADRILVFALGLTQRQRTLFAHCSVTGETRRQSGHEVCEEVVFRDYSPVTRSSSHRVFSLCEHALGPSSGGGQSSHPGHRMFSRVHHELGGLHPRSDQDS